MGWRERYDITDSGQKDSAANEDRTVLYYVDQPASAAFNPAQPIPPGFVSPVVRGTAHPRLSNLFAEDHRVTKQTGDSCEIETIYTTEAAAFNPNPNIQRLSHKRETSFTKVQIKVPIVRETRGRLITAPVGSPTRPSFEVDFITIEETQPVIQIQVTLPTFNNDDLRKIEAQDGAIHLIGGTVTPSYLRPARFSASDVVQHGPEKFRIVYTWTVDRGTREGKLAATGEPALPGSTQGEPSGLPNPSIYGTGPDEVKQYRPPTTSNMLQAPAPLGVGLNYGDLNKYIRSPFHEIHYILHTDLPPVFTQFCPFRTESNPPTVLPPNGLGWMTLPGSPVP